MRQVMKPIRYFVSLLLLTALITSMIYCSKEESKPDDKPTPAPAPSLTYAEQTIVFSSVTGVTKTLAVAKILAGVKGSKEGYTIKSITLVSSNTTASAKVSGTQLTFSKPGNIVFNLVLKHASKQDATIKNCKIIISKDAAATLTFNRVSKAFVSGGSFTTLEILGGVAGTKSGYTLKEIKALAPSGVANVTGTKPTLSLTMTKIGSFTATIVLEHSTKGDVTITGAQFKISTSAGESLTFDKLSEVYSSVGLFTTEEILGRIGGKKAGYTLREIRSLNPIGIASVTGTKPNLYLSYVKAGNFTATLVLEHATKGDSTIDNASFEVTKAPAPRLTWTKQSKPYGSGGEISNAELLAGLNGTSAAKTGYTIKSVIISSANGTGARVSGRGTSAKIVGYTQAGILTLTLVFQHPAKMDVTLAGKKFEITKADASTLTWKKQSKAYVSGGEISNAELLAGLTGSSAAKTGYTIKSVTISSANGTGARVSGNGTSAKIVGYTKVGILTLTLVFQHPAKVDVTLRGKEFEITKAVAERLTWTKQTKVYSSSGEITNAQLLLGVQGSKTGYTIKTVTIASAGGTGATVSGSGTSAKIIGYTKAGSLTLTIVLEHATKADVTLTGLAFEITKARAESLTFSKRVKSFRVGSSFSTSEILAGVAGTKTGYTLKEIKNLSPSGFARVNGTKPNLSLGMIRVGNFTATIILEHPNKADATITGTTFEINKGTWDKVFGGSRSDVGTSIVQTSDGGLAVTGSTESKGAGGDDFWLLKLDASLGTIVWEKTFGEKYNEKNPSLVQTSDGGVAVAGHKQDDKSYYDYYILKLSALGTIVWEKTFGGSKNEKNTSVIQTSDGGFALGGTRLQSAGGDYDGWVLKLDASGSIVWNKTFGGNKSDKVQSIVQTSDGGFAVAGYKASNSRGSYDAWVFKLNASGNKTWEKTFGGSNVDTAVSIIQTSDGGFAVTGQTNSEGKGSADMWILKLDASGTMVWKKVFGWHGYDIGHSIVQTSDGGFAVAGYTESKGSGESDFWVLKLDALGTMVWEKFFGGNDFDVAESIVQTSDGGFAVVGYTNSKGLGESDIWVLKLDKHGNL